MSAIGEDGVRIINDAVVRAAHITARDIEQAEARERREVAARATRYRQERHREPAISTRPPTAR